MCMEGGLSALPHLPCVPSPHIHLCVCDVLLSKTSAFAIPFYMPSENCKRFHGSLASSEPNPTVRCGGNAQAHSGLQYIHLEESPRGGQT